MAKAKESRAVKAVRDAFKGMLWIFKRAKKPDREQYTTLVKLTLLLVFILGAYSLIFSFAYYVVVSRSVPVSVPYPESLVIAVVVIAIIAALIAYLALSTRSIGKG